MSLNLDQNQFLIDITNHNNLNDNIPIVLVMMVPGSVNVLDFIDNIDAIVVGFLIGEGTGDAFADVIFGNHNPSGKKIYRYYY